MERVVACVCAFHAGREPVEVIVFAWCRLTWVNVRELRLNHDWVNQWKVLLSAATDGNEIYPLPIWDQRGPFVSGPGEACSESFLVVYVAASDEGLERCLLHAYQVLPLPCLSSQTSSTQ